MTRLAQYLMLSMATITFAAGVPAPAAAADRCAEKIIRDRASEIGGYEVWAVKASRPGVLAAFRKAGQDGVLMVGMAAVEPDLVTSQGVWGREGGSAMTADETAWLGKLFEKLYPDAAFRACPEMARKAAPSSDETFAAMQEWWTELNRVKSKSDASASTATFLWIAIAAGFIVVLAVVVLVRVRRSRKIVAAGAGEASPGEVPVEPRSETPGDEQVQPDEPEEVL